MAGIEEITQEIDTRQALAIEKRVENENLEMDTDLNWRTDD